MPIYEYKCRENGHIFEVQQSMKDEPLKVCTQCKSPVDQVISPGAFHLKGSGWFVTDYKDKPKTESAGEKTEVKKEVPK